MAKLPYMKKRGAKYYVRVPVPKEIQGVLDKVEVSRSLKTGDYTQAKKNYHDVMAKLHQLFEQARLKLNNETPVSLVGFRPLQAVREYYHSKKSEIAANGKSGFAKDVLLENYIIDLKDDLVELQSSKEKRYAFVELTAFGLLEQAGYPMKPNTSVVNVDFEAPQYTNLLDHLVGATIELREFELKVLGEKVQHTPNGGIYKNHSPTTALAKSSWGESENAIGTPIFSLINEYMDHMGSDTKKSTAKAKRAAFEYLTSIVGEEFYVENLKRSHFLDIRKILSAYPTNAKKLKALKGKSLSEKSDYAQKNNLRLMSKQNANKIIMRLKSLMQYAVDTDLLMKNPCSAIEFKITQAEKDLGARVKFSDAQLNKLFATEAFDLTYPKGAAMFWVPILALLHGFRMEEMLILTLKQVKKDDETGFHYFDLTDFTTDDLKNENALRRVPLHPELKNLGFYDYLKKCKNNKGLRLFPELKKSK